MQPSKNRVSWDLYPFKSISPYIINKNCQNYNRFSKKVENNKKMLLKLLKKRPKCSIILV